REEERQEGDVVGGGERRGPEARDAPAVALAGALRERRGKGPRIAHDEGVARRRPRNPADGAVVDREGIAGVGRDRERTAARRPGEGHVLGAAWRERHLAPRPRNATDRRVEGHPSLGVTVVPHQIGGRGVAYG